jgi:hypothetical protein
VYSSRARCANVTPDHCDHHVTGCRCEIVVRTTVIQALGIIGSDMLLFEANDKNKDLIERITYYIQVPLVNTNSLNSGNSRRFPTYVIVDNAPCPIA